jgi:ATP-dependent protease ClpP protease subunit
MAAAMNKPLIDLALASASHIARDHRPLGPGMLRINSTSSSEAEILVYGEIGGWWDGISAETFVPEIRALKADTIHLRVNSPGGSVFDGLAIYNAIAQHEAHVVAHVESLAASIASVIIMGADEIRIGESASIMIHKPWSMAVGDAEAMRKEADVLDVLEGAIVATYAARTGLAADELATMVGAETWLRGQEAVDKGFADSVTPNKGKKEKKALLNQPLLNLFKNTPADFLCNIADDPKIRQFEQLLRDGENCSQAQAKRLAVLAARVLGPQRDVEPPNQRDVGHREDPARDARDIAAVLRSITTL